VTNIFFFACDFRVETLPAIKGNCHDISLQLMKYRPVVRSVLLGPVCVVQKSGQKRQWGMWWHCSTYA